MALQKEVIIREEEIEREILQVLGEVITIFQKYSVDVRIVGSIARVLALEEPISSLNDYVRDIDIIIISGEDDSIQQAMIEANQIVKNCPYLSYLDPVFENKIIQQENEWLIRYKDITLNVAPEVFDTYYLHYRDLEIPSFHPVTLFHLITLGGSMRPKDWRQLIIYARKLKASGIQWNESLYRPFHSLSKLREKDYPKDSFIGSVRWIYLSLPKETQDLLSPFIRFGSSIYKLTLGWTEN